MASRVTGVPRPVGISVYDPDRSWNGYTVYAGGEIIDMNGNLVKHFDLSQLGKIMPGGYILGDRRYNGPRMERTGSAPAVFIADRGVLHSACPMAIP